MSISRGQFLRKLGSSVSGFAMGTGLASAAQILAAKAAGGAIPAVPAVVSSPASPVRFINQGDGSGNRMAITFDDGPTPGVTNVVLDELRKRNLCATFFMIGKKVVAAPELARRVLAEGHEVGNHTFNHLKLNTLSDPQVDGEIQKTQDTLGEVLNHRAVWLRPPYGEFRKNQIGIPQGKGLGVVLWSVDSRDWSQPGEDQIVHTILTETKPGSIILCHDRHQQTANCVARILDDLLERNFEFTTISALLGQPCQPHSVA